MLAKKTTTGKKGLEPCTFGFGDQCSTIKTIFLVLLRSLSFSFVLLLQPLKDWFLPPKGVRTLPKLDLNQRPYG